MTSEVFTALVFILSSAVQAQPGVSETAASTDADELVAALHAAHQEWIENVEFLGHYKLLVGTAESPESVFARSDSEVLLSLDQAAQGIIAKRDDLHRVSIEYIDASTVVGAVDATGVPLEGFAGGDDESIDSEKGEKLLVSYPSWDEVFDSSRSLIYRPLAGMNLYDQAVFVRRDRSSRMLKNGCTDAERELSPLNPVLGCNSSPFRGDSVLSENVTHSLESVDADYLTIVTTSEETAGSGRRYKQKSIVRWWTQPSIPVVDKVHRILKQLESDKKPYETCTVLEGFVECPGGMVASRVTTAFGVPGELAPCRVWESTDIGQRTPRDEDFVIAIPETTRVMGLAEPPPAGKARRLSLVDTPLSAFAAIGQPAGTTSPTGSSAVALAETRPDIPYWFLGGNLCVIIAIVAILLWRRRDRKGI